MIRTQQRAVAAVAVAVVVMGLALPVGAQTTAGQEGTRQVPLRSYNRFEFDPVTVSGVWLEAGAATIQDRRPETEPEYSAHVGFLRPAVGGQLWEAGLVFPFSQGWCVEVDEPPAKRGDCEGFSGIGDLSLYGKILPLNLEVSDWTVRTGGGFSLSVPTGNEDKLLGTGAVGLLPYATLGLEYGSFAARAHGGYEFQSETKDTAPELVVYGGGLYYRVNSQLALRSDFVATVARLDCSNPTAATWDPGVDVRLPLDGYRLQGVDLLLRVTPSIGMTAQAPEWGFGGGLTITWGWGA